MARIELISNSPNKAIVRLVDLDTSYDNSVSGARYIEWYTGAGSCGTDEDVGSKISTSNEFYISKPPGETFDIYAKVRKISNNEELATIYLYNVTPVDPYIKIKSWFKDSDEDEDGVTAHTITVSLAGLDSKATYNNKHIAWYLGDTEQGTNYNLGGREESSQIVINVPILDQSYTITANIADNTSYSTIDKFELEFKLSDLEIGGDDELEWTLTEGGARVDPYSYRRDNFPISNKYTLLRYRLRFTQEGWVRFYVFSETGDVIGYLSNYEDEGYYSGLEFGQPTVELDVKDYDDYEDSITGNIGIKFKYYVSAGAIYNFWMRYEDGKRTGNITLGAQYVVDKDEMPDCALNCTWGKDIIDQDGNTLFCENYPCISADSFNQFREDINHIHVRSIGSPMFNYTDVKPNEPMTADLWNEIIEQMYNMITFYPDDGTRVAPGQEITKEFINRIESDLKEIARIVYTMHGTLPIE